MEKKHDENVGTGWYHGRWLQTVWAHGKLIKTTLVSGTGNDREEGPAMISDE